MIGNVVYGVVQVLGIVPLLLVCACVWIDEGFYSPKNPVRG